MGNPYITVNKTVVVGALQSLALGFLVIGASEIRADAYSECNQILVQDIFNRTTNFDSKSASEKASAYASISQLSDHQAFEEYQKQHDEAKSRTESGEGGGSYLGFIEAHGGGSVDNKQNLSESEFSKRFNKAKEEYRKETRSTTSSSENLVSNYASYTRDPGTVAAWKECVTKSKDTNLYAYASRDNAGEIYVNVIWVPGVLAGSLPSIPVKFVTDGDADGVKIHADLEEQVAMGSGQSFAVSCGTKCDHGFQVTVNGTLKNAAGIKTNSFTSTVQVPPLKALEQAECTWEGDWDSEWEYGGKNRASSTITFKLNEEERIIGSYQYGNLAMKGKGNTLVGRWTNTAGTSGNKCTEGAVKFIKQGCSFEGAWGYCSDTPKFLWKGTKIQ